MGPAPLALLGDKGLSQLQAEIAAAEEVKVPPAANKALALLGRQAEWIAARPLTSRTGPTTLGVAAEIVGAQARGGRFGQQDGPDYLDHADEW